MYVFYATFTDGTESQVKICGEFTAGNQHVNVGLATRFDGIKRVLIFDHIGILVQPLAGGLRQISDPWIERIESKLTPAMVKM